MSGTMTWVGFDVHARSTHAAAINSLTGELSRVRFGPGAEGPLAWLSELAGPVRGCYEAGPTGWGSTGRRRLHKFIRTRRSRRFDRRVRARCEAIHSA